MNRLILLCIFLLTASGLHALPTYQSIATSTTANVFPFSTTTSNKTQVIYSPSDFAPSLVGTPVNINKFFIYVNSNATSTTFTNLTIKIGPTALSVFSSNVWATGLTQVYTIPSITFSNLVIGDWIELTLPTPYYWDVSSNIVVEMSQTAYTGGGFYLLNENGNGMKRLHGGVLNPNATNWATGQSKIGFSVIPIQCSGTPNAGVISFASSGTITCGQNVSFTMSNASAEPGIEYIWQQSADNGMTWTDFGTNATTATLSAVNTPVKVRCVTLCTHSNLSSPSNVLSVTVNPVPISIGNDTSICENAAITLSAASYNPLSVLWDDSSTAVNRTINTAGSYYIRLTHPDGCVSRDTIQVRTGIEPVNPLAASYNWCEASVLELSAGNPGMEYLWNTSATTRTINVTAGGNYAVTVTSADRCSKQFTTTVTARPKPVADLPATEVICREDSVLVDATALHGVQYDWSHGLHTPAVYLKHEGRYTVVITTAYGCQDSAATELVFRPDATTRGFSYIPGFFDQLKNVLFTPISPENVLTYHWDFGDGSSSDLREAQHLYEDFGDYTVRLTVSNDCGATVYTQPISIPESGTGIRENDQDILGIYPNPANNMLYLKSAEILPSPVFYIYGPDGRLLKTGAIADNSIPVDDLNDGNYLLEVYSEQKNVYRGKLMIVK